MLYVCVINRGLFWFSFLFFRMCVCVFVCHINRMKWENTTIKRLIWKANNFVTNTCSCIESSTFATEYCAEHLLLWLLSKAIAWEWEWDRERKRSTKTSNMIFLLVPIKLLVVSVLIFLYILCVAEPREIILLGTNLTVDFVMRGNDIPNTCISNLMQPESWSMGKLPKNNNQSQIQLLLSHNMLKVAAF